MNHFSPVLAGLAVLLAVAGPARAQAPTKPKAPAPVTTPSATTPDARYRSGKAQLDQGQYAAALKTLEPLAQRTARFARAADAAYLAAVAAAHLRQWPEAEQLLNLLRTEYPGYANMPDALFLQSQALFEQGDFDTALKTLALLPEGRLAPEREAMKATYLPRLKDRSSWQRLLKRYPDDATLARAYAERLVLGGAYTEADRPQLEELITRFSLDRARYTPKPKVTRKSSYNVAVLLPFEFSDPSWQTQRKLQFVTDLFAGMKVAQDSLQRAGRPLQLFAYDTGADTLKLKQVLAQPELAGMDLLVGPVYKSGARLLARFAQEHQIVCVNPLSQDGDLVSDNPWHYLFSASAATQGRVAAEFAAATYGVTKPAILLHEEAKDETDFATAYKAAFEAQGGKISAQRRFNPDNDESIGAAFAGLDLAGAGHVVVASDHRRSGPYSLSALAGVPAAMRPPVLGFGSWLDNPRLEVGQLSMPGLFLVHPKYYDERGPGFRRFRQLYLQRQNLPPSVFANQGYELLMYFGTTLHQFGAAFQSNISSAGASAGFVFPGQSYVGGAHDNQLVPIVKLENLEVQVVR